MPHRIKAGVDLVTFGGGSARSSMYAKPFKGNAKPETGAASESVDEDPNAPPIPGQYSLLGHDKKYENVDMEEIQEAPQM